MIFSKYVRFVFQYFASYLTIWDNRNSLKAGPFSSSIFNSWKKKKICCKYPSPNLCAWHVFCDYVVVLPISKTVERTCLFFPLLSTKN